MTTTTRAYYTTETNNPEEPERHDVLVTTEDPMSSYGQPVVLTPGGAIPAQQFGHALHMYWQDATGNEAAKRLVAKANSLSGHGRQDAGPEGFAGLFA